MSRTADTTSHGPTPTDRFTASDPHAIGGAEGLWIDSISAPLRTLAVEAFNRGDAPGFLATAGRDGGLELVLHNLHALQSRGIYETALLWAYGETKTNNLDVPPEIMTYLFAVADRKRLRAAGDPLPGPGPHTIYRGVAGRGRARRLRGWSWTASVEIARWFAGRNAELPAPAVFRVTVPTRAVLAYDNSRDEQEFLVWLPPACPLQRIE